MTGSHLERLNFVNGQRLEAADLRREQAYHMSVRRLLNQSLFDAGIAAGLEVNKIDGDGHAVKVSPGVALDEDGREIILLEERTVPVAGTPSTTTGIVYGNFLVIEYAEEPAGSAVDDCDGSRRRLDRSHSEPHGGHVRLRATPRLLWRDTLPRPGDRQVVLIQAELGADCKVVSLNRSFRRYAVPTPAPRTLAYALEGEKDIDPWNSKVLRFHVRGGLPRSVVLYLHSSLLSTLHYTEIGEHSHVDTYVNKPVDGHKHKIGKVTLDPQEDHQHEPLVGRTATPVPMLFTPGMGISDINTKGLQDLTSIADLKMRSAGRHTHEVKPLETEPDVGHTPSFTSTPGKFGATDQPASGLRSLTFVRDLRITVVTNAGTTTASAPDDITDRVVTHLRNRDPNSWPAGLGTDGSSTDELASTGTGPIDLMQLEIVFTPGEHHIVLKVPAGGGNVSYNLYVE